MFLYPQLPLPVALSLAEERRGVPVPTLADLAEAEHPDQVFTPVGGTRIPANLLKQLRKRVVKVAVDHGYPHRRSGAGNAAFDAKVGAMLHHQMNISAAEASKRGVWEFLSLVLLPDVVRWRFFASHGTTVDRFLGERRNAFGRLWRRAHLLQDPEADVSRRYDLLVTLGEDELVQIAERPELTGNPRTAYAMAVEFLAAVRRHPAAPRRRLIRESQKWFMRLSTFLSFDSLDPDGLTEILRPVYDRVAASRHG